MPWKVLQNVIKSLEVVKRFCICPCGSGAQTEVFSWMPSMRYRLVRGQNPTIIHSHSSQSFERPLYQLMV